MRVECLPMTGAYNRERGFPSQARHEKCPLLLCQLEIANRGKAGHSSCFVRDPVMTHRKLKIGYFTLEGLNSFATTYYLYYFYFYMQQVFGFGNRANLTLAALNGAIYAVASIYAGRFAQKHGYFLALKVGFAGMLFPLLLGSLVHFPLGHIVIMGFQPCSECASPGLPLKHWSAKTKTTRAFSAW